MQKLLIVFIVFYLPIAVSSQIENVGNEIQKKDTRVNEIMSFLKPIFYEHPTLDEAILTNPETVLFNGKVKMKLSKILSERSEIYELLGGGEVIFDQLHIWFSEDSTTAHFTFSSFKENSSNLFWHSILLSKNSAGQWKIIAWHRS